MSSVQCFNTIFYSEKKNYNKCYSLSENDNLTRLLTLLSAKNIFKSVFSNTFVKLFPLKEMHKNNFKWQTTKNYFAVYNAANAFTVNDLNALLECVQVQNMGADKVGQGWVNIQICGKISNLVRRISLFHRQIISVS